MPSIYQGEFAVIDETLSRAVRDFVGEAVPARRYEQLPAEVPRERIDGILAIVDSEGPGSEDLWEWGDRMAERARQAHPELNEDAVHAIESLITFDWR